MVSRWENGQGISWGLVMIQINPWPHLGSFIPRRAKVNPLCNDHNHELLSKLSGNSTGWGLGRGDHQDGASRLMPDGFLPDPLPSDHPSLILKQSLNLCSQIIHNLMTESFMTTSIMTSGAGHLRETRRLIDDRILGSVCDYSSRLVSSAKLRGEDTKTNNRMTVEDWKGQTIDREPDSYWWAEIRLSTTSQKQWKCTCLVDVRDADRWL